MRFEWHGTKADSNFRKHGVTFLEAASVFDDPLSFDMADPNSSEMEGRFIVIGMSAHRLAFNFLRRYM